MKSEKKTKSENNPTIKKGTKQKKTSIKVKKDIKVAQTRVIMPKWMVDSIMQKFVTGNMTREKVGPKITEILVRIAESGCLPLVTFDPSVTIGCEMTNPINLNVPKDIKDMYGDRIGPEITTAGYMVIILANVMKTPGLWDEINDGITPVLKKYFTVQT